MWLDKLLSVLIYPLGLSLLLGFTGLLLWVLRRQRIAVIFLAMSLGWLLLWSLPPVADAVAGSLEGKSAHQVVEVQPQADVILVFGGVMRPALPGYAYPNLGAAADRVWHAARLYHAGKAPKVILSGGRNDWQTGWPSQAETMAQFLRDLGVPAAAILLEDRSRSTYENAIYCAKAMRAAGLQRALLVTSALHMPRSLAALRSAGVEAIPAATDFEAGDEDEPSEPVRWLPSAEALQSSTRALHEWIGIAVYRWRGWI